MKRTQKCKLALSVGLLALLLSACRSSPVLEEVIYTYTAPEVDEDIVQLDPEDDGQEDEQFDNQELDTADTIRDTTAQEGLTDTQGDAEQSMVTNYDANTPNDAQATNQPTQATSTESPTPTTSESPASTAPETTAPSDASGGDVDGEVPLPQEVPGATRTYKQVVDATGQTVDVPEDVGTVTAVGAAAQMVEMLGGTNRLIGTDSGLLSSSLAQSTFSDLGSVSGYWQSSNGGISEESFSSLLATKPDVCFAFSGQSTFTDAQVAQLEENDISYVVLPALNSVDNLKSAVSLVGEVLGGQAVDVASDYNSWVDDIVSDVSSRTSGISYITLYLSGWDSDATYTLNEAYTPATIPSTGSGMAVAYSPLKAQLVSPFLSVAHLTNESTNILSRYRDSTGVYVAPMFHQFNAVVSGGRGVYYASGLPTAYDLFVSHQAADSIYYQLGWQDVFPAIIVANQSVKTQIESTYFWQYHECNTAGYVEEGGQNLYRGIAGPYEIYVNPQGMCDWAEGSVESPLEAIWAACQFTEVYSMEDVKNETQYFYEHFFGVTLTEGQLSEIFGD